MIGFELTSANGEKLWLGSAEDPRVKHLEYEEVPHSGGLQRKIIRADEAEMTIRVPFLPGAHRLLVHALEPPVGATKHQNRVVKRDLGTVEFGTNGIPTL